jgi:hypothetical protein
LHGSHPTPNCAKSARQPQGKVTMSVQYFAKVTSPENHAAFQRLVKHYPSCTYEEWQFREQKKMADWKGRRHAIKLVEITPAEFEAYCKKTGKPPDLTTFLKAVTDKAF